MVRRALLAALFLLPAIPAAAQTPSALDRVLPPEARIYCHALVPNCAFRVLDRVGVQAGFEDPAPLKDADKRELAKWIDCGGMTVRQVLDKAVELDPFFEWREIDGIVILRPRTAWSDSNDALNRPMPSPFVLSDVDMTATVDILAHGAETWQWPPRGKLISVSLERATFMEVLNAVVRAHGRASWSLYFSQAERPMLEITRGPSVAGVAVSRWAK